MVAPIITPSKTAQLIAGLNQVESIRKKIRLNYTVIGTVLLIGLIIEAVTWMSIAVAIIILFVLVYTNWYGIPVSKFEKSFIETITKNTVGLIHSALQIDYQSHLKLSEITGTKLIPTTPDYFSGKNLIYGDINTTSVRISEIYCHWKNTAHVRSDAKHIFNGLVAKAENNAYNFEDMEMSTNEQDLTQALKAQPNLQNGNWQNKVFYWAKSLNDKNIQFANQHAQQLSNFTTQTHKQVKMGVSSNTMMIAIINPDGFNYFNPSIFKTVFDTKALETYYSDLQFLINCVTEVN